MLSGASDKVKSILHSRSDWQRNSSNAITFMIPFEIEMNATMLHLSMAHSWEHKLDTSNRSGGPYDDVFRRLLL